MFLDLLVDVESEVYSIHTKYPSEEVVDYSPLADVDLLIVKASLNRTLLNIMW